MDPGERETVELLFEAAREGVVAVGGVEAGRLAIRTSAADSASIATDSDGLTGGFHAVPGVLTILSVVFVGLTVVWAAFSRAGRDGG